MVLKEYGWLQHVKDIFQKDELERDDNVSWTAFHASNQPPFDGPVTAVSLLPQFLENAHSVAMINHTMNTVIAAVDHLNPNQVPVIVMDQPFFAIAKQIQWTMTER